MSLSSLLKTPQTDLKTMASRSKSWFNKQVADLRGKSLNPDKLLRRDTNNLVNYVKPGEMYMFLYDPKHKGTLPYYDKFPLVLPFEKTVDGFIGLNLHYLPYHLRAKLLDTLMEYRNNTRMDETTKIRMSWSLVSSVSKLAIARPCVKRYLNSQVRSMFKRVPAVDWSVALLLPVEQFQNATSAQVWRDSIRITK